MSEVPLRDTNPVAVGDGVGDGEDVGAGDEDGVGAESVRWWPLDGWSGDAATASGLAISRAKAEKQLARATMVATTRMRGRLKAWTPSPFRPPSFGLIGLLQRQWDAFSCDRSRTPEHWQGPLRVAFCVLG